MPLMGFLADEERNQTYIRDKLDEQMGTQVASLQEWARCVDLVLGFRVDLHPSLSPVSIDEDSG